MQKQSYSLPSPLNGLIWLEAETPTLAIISGSGQLHLLRAEMIQPFTLDLAPHQALLAMTVTPQGVATVSEDGQLHLTTAAGESTLLTALPHKFPEHLAYSPHTKQLIWAAGKHMGAVSLSGTLTAFAPAPSTIGGMALSPLGPRLATSHYGGVHVHDLKNPKTPPRQLSWKGSHLGLTYSPCGKWLISSMQEQALHLWRLSDGMDLQMRNYPGPISQFSWSHCGHWLATTGGHGVPLWNFADKLKGPAGQHAKVVADSGEQSLLVTAMAMHPKGPFLAIGYANGLTLLTDYTKDTSIILQGENGHSTTHLAWSASGFQLGIAQAHGALHLANFNPLS